MLNSMGKSKLSLACVIIIFAYLWVLEHAKADAVNDDTENKTQNLITEDKSGRRYIVTAATFNCSRLDIICHFVTCHSLYWNHTMNMESLITDIHHSTNGFIQCLEFARKDICDVGYHFISTVVVLLTLLGAKVFGIYKWIQHRRSSRNGNASDNLWSSFPALDSYLSSSNNASNPTNTASFKNTAIRYYPTMESDAEASRVLLNDDLSIDSGESPHESPFKKNPNILRTAKGEHIAVSVDPKSNKIVAKPANFTHLSSKNLIF